jgi:predicted GIY-YIG superfamily endonuclease
MSKDYSKTSIYKICCNDANITDIYIGHTTNFNNRKKDHKKDCNNDKMKNYNFIRENGGWNNWNMIIIENYQCNNIKEATIREGFWIKELKATLNVRIAGRTDKEWYLDNKENRAEYMKEYRNKRKRKTISY